MLRAYAELLPPEIIERAKRLDTALICDGIAKAGLDISNGGCMDAAIMPVERGMKLIGTAATVETSDGDNFPIHIASYSAPAEGYVMVIDGKNCQDRAYAGDLIMGACKAIGFAGIVCDGLTRDRDGNIDTLDNYPVFSRGFSPRGPYKKTKGLSTNLFFAAASRWFPGIWLLGTATESWWFPGFPLTQSWPVPRKKLGMRRRVQQQLPLILPQSAKAGPFRSSPPHGCWRC